MRVIALLLGLAIAVHAGVDVEDLPNSSRRGGIYGLKHGAANDEKIYGDIETVHIVYMTHLDIGFTKTVAEVLNDYCTDHFPRALNTTRTLRERGGEEQFSWTSHAWIIHECLNNKYGDERVKALEAGLKDGSVTWHAGAANLQAGLYSANLYQTSLRLSKALDKRFEKPTKTVMSQKDVPGLTKAAIPQLVAAEVEAIHIGANDFSMPAAMPNKSPELMGACNAFKWRHGETNSKVIGFLCSGYSNNGEPIGLKPEMHVVLPNFKVALAFLMNVDNTGPHTADQVVKAWANTKKTFPNAKLVSSSLEGYMAELRKRQDVKDALPETTEEMGDSWMYGAASDPLKISQWKEMTRSFDDAIIKKEVSLDDPSVLEAGRMLVKIGEHTWGIDGNPDYDNWSNEKFQPLRQTDAYQRYEKAWLEQRNYNQLAVDALPDDNPLKAKLKAAMEKVKPQHPSTDNMEVVELNNVEDFTFRMGIMLLKFDKETGAIKSAVNRLSKRSWADDSHKLGILQYRTYSEKDFTDFQDQYNRCPPHCHVDAFGKPGMSKAEPASSIQQATLKKMWYTRSSQPQKPKELRVDRLLLELQFSDVSTAKYGAPKLLYMDITLDKGTSDGSGISMEVQWFEKPSTRLAEALFASFHPIFDDPSWELDVMGSAIDPHFVAVNGSRAVHAANSARHVNDGKTTFSVESLDAPILTMGPKLNVIQFDQSKPGKKCPVNFVLYNNAWNTNYPLWSYDSDAKFRFIAHFG